MNENENHYHVSPFIKGSPTPYSSLWLSAMDELDDRTIRWYGLEANGLFRPMLPHEIESQRQRVRTVNIHRARLYLEALYQRPY